MFTIRNAKIIASDQHFIENFEHAPGCWSVHLIPLKTAARATLLNLKFS